MLTFLDVVQKESFRESVLQRLRAGISDPAFAFPERFPRLYKYRGLSEYAVNDIVNHSVTATSIGSFNDLFDGAIHKYGSKEEIEQAAEQEWRELEEAFQKAGFPGSFLPVKQTRRQTRRSVTPYCPAAADFPVKSGSSSPCSSPYSLPEHRLSRAISSNAIFFSNASSACLRANPPAYPVSEPFVPITRWQGIRKGIGLTRLAAPTARLADGLPIAWAIWR